MGLGCVLLSAACGVETIVHNLEEREANQIIELLAENDISTTKSVIDNGRTMVYTISVPTKSRVDAIRLLNRYEMPRRRDMGYAEVFKDGGLIPTAVEEKAKGLSALEGEIERQLKLVDGILDVRVQLVLPEESALRTSTDARTPTTASVTIKYLAAAGGAKPLSEPQVQAIVAAGVEKLTPDQVVVVMTPAVPLTKVDRGDADSRNHGMSAKQLNMALVFLVGLILVLSLVLALSQMRLRTVRGRLVRLQTEIVKARRKPETPPPNG